MTFKIESETPIYLDTTQSFTQPGKGSCRPSHLGRKSWFNEPYCQGSSAIKHTRL